LLWHAQVILDEFEKLETKAMLGFLEAWDTGRWVDSSTQAADTVQTRSVDCTKTIFILVTNILLKQQSSPNKLKEQLPFPREVSGRITQVFPYTRYQALSCSWLCSAAVCWLGN
jgi:ATP-dependent Clp protease ATP-binding subunit ClpA